MIRIARHAWLTWPTNVIVRLWRQHEGEHARGQEPALTARQRGSRAGEEVVRASNGEPMVRLVPIAKKGHLSGCGKLKRFRPMIDEAFTSEVDEQIARSLEGRM